MMTGMMDPSWLWVLALNCLQNSIMFTPCCPRAGPTGGAGLAFPAGICNLTRVLTSFAKTCPFPLQPLDLRKPQLHRSAPAKNADEEILPSRGAILACLDLDNVLVRHQHLSDLVLQAHLVRALHNAVLDTALESLIGVHNVPVLAHDAVLAHSIFTISKLIKISANLKNSDTISTKTITTVVDPIVSLRLGYEIFFSSERTSLKNSTRAALVCANIFSCHSIQDYFRYCILRS